MCFHSREDIENYRRWEAEQARKAENEVKREIRTTAFLKVVDASGTLVGAMPVSVLNLQEIANVRRDLKHWHPHTHVSLREINKARAKMVHNYAPKIRVADLPVPTGAPAEGLTMQEGNLEHNVKVVREYQAAYA